MRVRSADDLLRDAQQVSPALAERLVAWQRSEGRHHLPWQQVRDPYRVWLSEIMLQQTQVSTVLGYFDRFLVRFPDVQALAAAPQDEVLALWAGLGYYSRARNLHRCAQAVVAEHGGVFPRSAAALQTLPGIGPSTASAIAAFCFNERISIMDGNVKRVLGRVLAWGQDLSVKAHERALWAAAQAVLPARAEDMPAYTQGLMDLGATLCTPRKPACLTCPWSDLCLGRREGDPERFPVKGRKLVRGERESWLPWLVWRDQVWLQQMPQTGVWGGLWTLPLLDSEAALQTLLGTELLALGEPQPRTKHVLTHLDWWLNVRRVELPHDEAARALAERLRAHDASGRWVAMAELARWGLPAPLKRWLVG
ncbi:A/G-specific adenine glycosylase [uncultured Aquabacterium sp.]|uniref:A/G-specific adenine glycosylase n=1 Tax=Aquabacterium sp. TaxID=1872578 RepID=UPI0025FC771F|nr:A/G-specific adenine glycosylase [uncultured Aquabacterium sp.]